MNKPLVSVIIPTYNRSNRVLAAIESVLSQTYSNIQLIVVDDGSDDDTKERLEHLAGFQYVLQPHAGQAAARNTGLQYVRGELIASLDSDDYWTVDFVEKCVQAIERYELDFVFANWHQAHKSGEWRDFLSFDPYITPFVKDTSQTWHILNDSDLRALYLKACPSPSSSLIMRKSSMVSQWNQHLNIGDDWCLYLDMIINKSCKAAFTFEMLWYKDIDGQNIYDGREWSEVVRLLLVEDTFEVMNKYRHLLTRHELSILQNRYINGLVELAKHKMLRERNLSAANSLLCQSFNIGLSATLIAIPKVIFRGFRNHFDLIAKKIKHWCNFSRLRSSNKFA